ncbi:hypothetical protein OROMI_013717 [Orobanche minor]
MRYYDSNVPITDSNINWSDRDFDLDRLHYGIGSRFGWRLVRKRTAIGIAATGTWVVASQANLVTIIMTAFYNMNFVFRYLAMDADFDDDLFAGEAVKKAKPVGKFQPKAKFRPTKKDSTVTSISTSQTVHNINSTQTEFSEPVANAKPSDPCSDALPNDNGGWHAFLEKSVGEEVDAMDSENTTQLTIGSEKNSIPTLQQDDILDLSSLDFTDTLPNEPTSELPLNEESSNHLEMVQLDSGIHLQDVYEIPAKLVSRRAETGSSRTLTASNPSPDQQEASPSHQDNETGRSLRPRKRKTNFCELVDEDEGVPASIQVFEECPLSSPIEEENIINEEFQVEGETRMEKSKRKSEKPDDDKEKPSRKRKKAKEVLDEDAGAKLKKFSHSTRRRRVVDKVLLETPEDEIDYQKVPLRDLIARAEHQEKQMKKKEAEAGAPVTEQSNGNHSGLYNEDETFISKQDVGYNDGEQGSPVEEDTTVFFNYQTYMDKTPSTRWSKQDTELFYEAVSQFGTDLTMIQQLFPDRTRRQVKLKYKKEERQHPVRLRDALTNRTKDHCHFKKVIEYLKQVAAEEKQNADEDDQIDSTGNEVADEEGTSNGNADDEEWKGDNIQEGGDNDEADDFVPIGSPLKSDDGEDELFLLSQYKSN